MKTFRITCTKCGSPVEVNELVDGAENVGQGLFTFEDDAVDTSGLDCPTCEFTNEELEAGVHVVTAV